MEINLKVEWAGRGGGGGDAGVKCTKFKRTG